MKKLLSFAIFCLMFFCTNSAFSLEVVDVSHSHKNAVEIANAINKGFMGLDGNKFHPEDKISRAEFVRSLLKVMKSEDVENTGLTQFNDVNKQTKYEESILTSEQLRLIVGYPDKSFKPTNPILRSEANCVLANVTKGFFGDISVLDRFADVKNVPNWALYSYSKNVHNNILIDKGNLLRPNDYLTRAEAAKLYSEIEKQLYLVQEKYKVTPNKVESEFVGQNTLRMVKNPPRDVVEIYNTKNVVQAGNIILMRPLQPINSKVLEHRDQLAFVAVEDAYTQEGTLLFPAGTNFVGDVQKLGYTPFRHKKQKNLIVLRTIALPNGTTHEMAGVPYTTDKGKVVTTKATKKDKESTVKEDYFEGRKQISKADFLIKYTDKLSPLVKYDLTESDVIYVLLTGDLVIPNENYWEFEVDAEYEI